MLLMTNEIRINVRTTAEIKRDIEIAAKLRGMTVSSLINSLAVKAIREEKEYDPTAFSVPILKEVAGDAGGSDNGEKQ